MDSIRKAQRVRRVCVFDCIIDSGHCRNEQDARELFKFMKSERIGEKHAVFYKAFAEFEAAHGERSVLC